MTTENLSENERNLLAVLRERGAAGEAVRVTQAELGRAIDRESRTVRRAIVELERRGLISVAGVDGRANDYRLLPAAVEPAILREVRAVVEATAYDPGTPDTGGSAPRTPTPDTADIGPRTPRTSGEPYTASSDRRLSSSPSPDSPDTADSPDVERLRALGIDPDPRLLSEVAELTEEQAAFWWARVVEYRDHVEKSPYGYAVACLATARRRRPETPTDPGDAGVEAGTGEQQPRARCGAWRRGIARLVRPLIVRVLAKLDEAIG